jgi:hypothetical protein
MNQYHFKFIGAATRYTELMNSLRENPNSDTLNKATESVFVAMDDIKEHDKQWAEFFRGLLEHDVDGVAIYAGFALKDVDRQAAIKTLRRVASHGGLVGNMAKESLKHQFGVVVAPR